MSLHIIPCTTWRSHPLWLAGKRARVRKWQSTQVKIMGLWPFEKWVRPETLLGCWSGNWSLNWTKSASYWPPGHWAVFIIKPCNSPCWYLHLLYNSAPFHSLVRAIFRIGCWHEWLIPRNCVISAAMNEPTAPLSISSVWLTDKINNKLQKKKGAAAT